MKTTKRIWNNERLELNRLIINRLFPDSQIKKLASMKRIIREQEELNGVSVEEHNKLELELNEQDKNDA
jgi:hypothetical protein